MNRTVMKSVVAAILIFVANIGLFLFGESFGAVFWISYIFTMTAALIASYVLIFYINEKPYIQVYEISAVTTAYLVLAVIAGFICRNFLFLWPVRAFFIQLCILALFGVAFIFVMIHGSHVAEQQQTRSTDLMNFKYILDNMKSAVSKVDYSNPQRKALMHAYDSLASGQVTSNEVVFDVEKGILDAVEALKSAITNGDSAKIEELCKTIEDLAEERKRKLSLKRPF
ncbi:MAG: hypothetical protein IJJ64_02685 [Butyrivibrio sp.]|nr:hypothetical protein [Butyrivibrio sp.]